MARTKDQKKISFYKSCRKKGLSNEQARKRWEARKTAAITVKDI